MLKSNPQGRLGVAAGHVLGYASLVQLSGARTPGTLRRASRDLLWDGCFTLHPSPQSCLAVPLGFTKLGWAHSSPQARICVCCDTKSLMYLSHSMRPGILLARFYQNVGEEQSSFTKLLGQCSLSTMEKPKTVRMGCYCQRKAVRALG